jgi:hypothetical protein
MICRSGRQLKIHAPQERIPQNYQATAGIERLYRMTQLLTTLALCHGDN